MLLDQQTISQSTRSPQRQRDLLAASPDRTSGHKLWQRSVRILGALALSASLITGCSIPLEQQSTPGLIAEASETPHMERGDYPYNDLILEIEYEKDHIAVTAFKTIVVFGLLRLAILLTIFTGLIDLVLMFFGLHFPLTTRLWAFAWQTVTINWYWDHATTVGVVIGVMILLTVLDVRLYLKNR